MHTYQPLYLKYRPQSLADLVGQSSVAKTLTNAIENDRISHAYLFTGPRGTGKTSSARILAKSLNCEQGPTPTPCLVCSSCLEVKAGNSPSVFEIDAASNNSVDDARTIIERAPLVAQGGRNKLYIIDECHMLTKEAFNALLKTIEEPPPSVVFILATTEEHKVPPTIISRCQRLMFKLVSQKDLLIHLRNVATKENIHIDDEALTLIARRSGGGLRDALGLLDQASLLASEDKPVGVVDLLVLLGAVHEDVLLTISDAMFKRDGYSVLQSINQLLADGREPAVLVLELAKHFLSLTKASYVNDTGGVTVEALTSIVLGSPSYLQGVVTQSKNFDRAELAQMVEYLDRLEQTCRKSSQPNLSLEMGLLALCHRHDITFVKELDQRISTIEDVLGDEIARGPAKPGTTTTNNKPAIASSSAPHAVTTSAPSQAAAARAPIEHSATGSVSSGYTASVNTTTGHSATGSAPSGYTASVNTTTGHSATGSASSGYTASVNRATGNTATENTATENTATERASNGSPVPNASAHPHRGDTPSPSELNSISAQASGLRDAVPSQVEQTSGLKEVKFTDRVAPDDDDYDPEPLPASVPNSSTEITHPAERSNSGGMDVDQFWSELRDALQKRHIPTFSIVTTHAFPVSFENEDFVLGVRTETYQKMLDNKIEHLKVASATVVGKPVHVRIKVIADTTPGASSGRPGSSVKPQNRPKDARSSPSVDPAPSEESDRRPPREADTRGLEQRGLEQRDSDLRNAPAAGSDKTTSSSRGHSAVTTSIDPDSINKRIEAGQLAEAYKLFEGPGSRLIS